KLFPFTNLINDDVLLSLIPFIGNSVIQSRIKTFIYFRKHRHQFIILTFCRLKFYVAHFQKSNLHSSTTGSHLVFSLTHFMPSSSSIFLAFSLASSTLMKDVTVPAYILLYFSGAFHPSLQRLLNQLC